MNILEEFQPLIEGFRLLKITFELEKPCYIRLLPSLDKLEIREGERLNLPKFFKLREIAQVNKA